MLNVGVGLLLRSPLRGLVSGRVMLPTVTGRRSGGRFTVPVGYLRYGGDILGFTSGGGASGGGTCGRRAGSGTGAGKADIRRAWAETGGDAVVRGLDAFLTEFPAAAGRYGVGLDADGRPLPQSVEAAVREGRAVMFVVKPKAPEAC